MVDKLLLSNHLSIYEKLREEITVFKYLTTVNETNFKTPMLIVDFGNINCDTRSQASVCNK